MNVREKFNLVDANRDFIILQINEDNHNAKTMANCYDLCITKPDPCAMALFESSFDDWFNRNKEAIKCVKK